MNTAVPAAIRLGLANPEIQVKYLYSEWETGFIAYWGVRIEENGRGSQLFINTHQIDTSVPMTFPQAARIFHNNTVRFPGGFDQLRRYVEDFDKIPPELAEIPLDSADWDKIEREDALWHPKPPKQVMDMAPRPRAGEVRTFNLGDSRQEDRD